MDEILGYCLLNRDFKMPDDGWYHIAPVGTFSHPSGVQQVIDNRSINAMVNSFKEDRTKLGDHFPGLLVDFDHFSNDPKAPSEAAGWIDDLQNRTGKGDDDGLWAKIRWSDTGEAAVKGGRYRLVSPVWNRADCEKVGDDSLRPLRLDRAAITNDPNLKGMNPLSNRDGAETSQEESTHETVEEEIPLAATRADVQTLRNAGTSEGARKGWVTRRAGASGKPKVGTPKIGSPKKAATKPKVGSPKNASGLKINPKFRYQSKPSLGDRPAEDGEKPDYLSKEGPMMKAAKPGSSVALKPAPQIHIHVHGDDVDPDKMRELTKFYGLDNRRREIAPRPTTTFDGEEIFLAAQKPPSARHGA